jgi:Histidine kinase-, DNA gyrase B-, and HSP90-like ATPase
MDLTPPVHLLRMWMAQRPNYPNLFCEAVDNAFDAGARRISITQRADRITFEDDGAGITLERLPALFIPGQHAGMSTTRLGQFGIGITTQAIAAGSYLEVETISSDGCYTAALDWREMLKGGRWHGADPAPRPFVVGQHTGALIVLSHLKKTTPIATDRIIAELSDRFHPALMDGREIIFNRMRLSALADPQMSDVVQREFTFEDGRRAHLHAGILTSTSKRNRVHISLAHRVIMTSEPFGCGKYGGITKMFARLQLIGSGWKPTPLKDEFADQQQRDELEAEVNVALQPILEKCQAASFDAKIAGIRDRIIARLPPELAPSRPIRKRKRSPGPPPEPPKPKPKPNEVEQEQAEDSFSGPTHTRRSRTGPLKIDFEGKDEEDGIAGYRKGPPPRINLPLDNPTILRLVRCRDEDLASEALLSIILCVYLHHQNNDLLDTYGRRVANLLLLNQTVQLPRVETED